MTKTMETRLYQTLFVCIAVTLGWFAMAPGRKRNALISAVEQGNASQVKTLLERGANPNTTKTVEFGNGTLKIPVTKIALEKLSFPRHSEPDAYREICRLLINAGADAKSREFIDIAVMKEDKAIVDLLLQKGADIRNSPFGNLISWGHLDLIKRRLQMGEDLNRTSRRMPTLPLAILALTPANDTEKEKRMLEVGEMLIAHGALVNPNSPTNQGIRSPQFTPPLTAAVMVGNLSFAKFLLSHGADVNAGDSNGYTALHTAVNSGEKANALIPLLLQYHADVNAKSSRGETPLAFAKNRKASPAVMELLKKAGAR